MNISKRFSRGQTARAVLVCLCVIMLLTVISAVSAKPRGFGNNPHNGGFNHRGNYFGSGGMKFNQDNLKMGTKHNFGPASGSGRGGSPISVSPVGTSFGGNKGGFTGSGGTKPAAGPTGPSGFGTGQSGNGGFMGSSAPQTTTGSCGFGTGNSNSGGIGKGPSIGSSGGTGGLGGNKGFGGGYHGNGFLMTRCGSDVVIKMPFNNCGKSTGGKGGAVFGCGDAFSKVFSGPGFKCGSFNRRGLAGPKGPKLNCSPCPKKCGGNNGPGHGRWKCGKWRWGKDKKGHYKCRRWRWKRHKCCKPCPPHDDDNDTDADFDCDMDLDFDCDMDLDTDMDTDIDLDCDIDLDTDLDLDTDIDDDVTLVPAAPLWLENDVEFSGCPALMGWLAAELGVPREQLQVYIVNTRTSFRDINPCDMCARLQNAALILHDRQGIRMAVPGAPISPEQMMDVAQRLAEPEPGSVYERAAEYLSAAETYVTVLTEELGYSTEEAFTQVARYIGSIDDLDVADYVTARLITIG
jgi:hypothetical protein